MTGFLVSGVHTNIIFTEESRNKIMSPHIDSQYRIRTETMKRLRSILLVIVSLSLVCSCREEHLYRVSRSQLGTLVTLTVITTSESEFTRFAEGTYARIEEIEAQMSPYREESDIHRINTRAREKPVAVSEETITMIKRSCAISRETDGYFDITFATLSPLWNFTKKPFIPPNQKEIDRLLPAVNYRYLQIDRARRTIFLKNRSTKIGLGGIAKGYAIQRGVEYLKREGVTAAIVEAGGDLQVIGTKFGKPWRAGLVHPRKKNIMIAITLFDMESIATSGDYERYAIYRNRRYHHLIDPKTGYPARSLASVSVITHDPVLADAYATALFIMGKEKAMRFLSNKSDLSAILIDMNMTVHASRSLQERITLFEKGEIIWF